MITPTPRPSSRAPERTCIGCREKGTKLELLRVTCGWDAHDQAIVVADPRGTAPGRGAYLHPDQACLAQAERRRAIGRALRYAGGPLELSVLRTYLEEISTEVSEQRCET